MATRRLDPRTILVESAEYIRRIIIPILIPIVLNIKSDRRPSSGSKADIFFIWIPVAIGLFSIIGGLISYLVTRFGIEDGVLTVRKKGIWRQERTIPLERIQNVTLSQNFLEKLLKVRTVNVETASGQGAEAKLKSLSMADSEELCQALLSSKNANTLSEEVDVKPAEPPAVYTASFKDLMLAGALQNRALYIVAVIGGLFNNNIGDLIKMVIRALDRIPYLKATSESPILLGLAFTLGIAVLLAVGWILSIALAVITYHGFRVVRREKGIDIQYGLFNTVRTTLQINKIQSISTNSSWLFRLFDFSQLHAQSIGGFKVNEQVATGQTLLAPIARPQIITEIMDLIYPQVKLKPTDFRMCHPYFRQRELISSSIGWAFLIAMIGGMFRVIFNNPSKPLSAFVTSGAYVAVLVGVWGFATLVHAYTSLVAYKRLGFIVLPEFIYVRSGVFNENISIQPVKNIQSVELRSNPFARRKGLVDIIISTPVSSSTIPCLTKEDGERLMEELMRQSTHAGI